MDKWWLKSGIIYRFAPNKQKLTYDAMTGRLPELAGAGFNCIEIVPPYHGGVQYSGLDPIDFYNATPQVGDLGDQKRFLDAAHGLGLKVIASINLGYSAEEHPDFLKACRDVRDGVESREVKMFLWSDSPDVKMVSPLAPHFLQDADGRWVFNETAGKYYWCKWFGEKGDVQMPQYNFGAPEWQDECKRIVRFWRARGFDGFIVDAVSWYIDCNWEINRSCIIGPAFEQGEVFIQPEGGGGFNDDPAVWITKGGYNCVQNYSLAIWWKNKNLIEEARAGRNASCLRDSIEQYRNRVTEAGGVCYFAPGRVSTAPVSAALKFFELALVVAIGHMVICHNPEDFGISQEATSLFRLQASTPALAAAGKRELLPTGDDAALGIRCHDEQGKHIDAIFNFGSGRYIHKPEPVGYARETYIEPDGFVFLDEQGNILFPV